MNTRLDTFQKLREKLLGLYPELPNKLVEALDAACLFLAGELPKYDFLGRLNMARRVHSESYAAMMRGQGSKQAWCACRAAAHLAHLNFSYVEGFGLPQLEAAQSEPK